MESPTPFDPNAPIGTRRAIIRLSRPAEDAMSAYFARIAPSFAAI